MPKKPKSGPPYTDVPGEVYVVVTNPWGMGPNPRSRDKGDFNHVASWAQFALRELGVTGGSTPTVECIYAMGTRDEIIIQFPECTNILPLLGEHRWVNFWKHCAPDDPRSTCVFSYNWRNNGNPANHNWTVNFPVILDNIPAKTPYPPPSWVSRPHTLANLVFPIPPPLPDHAQDLGQDPVTLPLPATVTPPSPPTPKTEGVSGGQPAAQDSSTHLFRPYKPPSQHPSHARFLNQSQAKCVDPSSSEASLPSLKFVKKLDPYELDEDALDLVRSFKAEGETEDYVKAEHLEVKTEGADVDHAVASGSEYQPSQALIDAFNSLRGQEQSPPSAALTHDPQRLNAEVKTEEDDTHRGIGSTSEYQPSQALVDAFNSLQQHEQQPRLSAVPANRSQALGLDTSRDTAASSPSGSDPRVTPSTCVVVTIKREYEDDVSLSPVEGKRKKIKVEED